MNTQSQAELGDEARVDVPVVSKGVHGARRDGERVAGPQQAAAPADAGGQRALEDLEALLLMEVDVRSRAGRAGSDAAGRAWRWPPA